MRNIVLKVLTIGVFPAAYAAVAMFRPAPAYAQLSCGGASSPANNSPCMSVGETGTNGTAISADAPTTGGTGVNATGFTYGVVGNSMSGTGVLGQSLGGGIGVNGSSGSYFGVYGQSNSSVGVYGTTSANSLGTAAGYFYTAAGSNSTALIAVNSSSAAATAVYAQSAGGGFAGYFEGNLGYTGSFGKQSDERLKRDIEPLKDPIGQVLHTRGVSFYWKDPSKHGNATGIQRGFIAQEFEKAFPEWVSTGPDGFKMIDTTGLDALEVESIRALKTENDLLKQRVAALESARQPRISGFNLNGVGFGLGGLAIGLGLVISRRKREGQQS